jgi:glycosyltransferase involved in cell wall biosynthesis
MLSIAMIVKNEEKNLPRCLESLKGLFAEIIIVDTGSIDRTPKIAQDYGAKLYYHAWENDFSKHRNQSFGYATGDWILQIDADEELVFYHNRSPRILLDFLSRVKSDIHAIAFEIANLCKGKNDVSTYAPRLFRNGKVKYKRKIHNEPVYKGDTGLFTFGRLNHYGYDLEPHERQVKAKRTISLLLKSIEEDKKDYDSMFYLCQAYSDFSLDMNEALKWALEYAKRRGQIAKGKFYQSVYYTIITIYMKLGNLKEAWKWIEIALKEIPGDLDISMALLRYGLMTKNRNLAAAGSRGFVNAFINFDKDICNNATKFCFNRNVESYAFALFHLSVSYLEHSKIELQRLYEVMPKLSKRLSDEFQQGLKDWFEKNETIFKHTDSMFQTSAATRTLHSLSPKPDGQGRRTLIHLGR